MSGTIAEKKLLYQLYTKRDPEAYAQLYDLYVKRIYRFVYFKVSSHEEAEDVTSEVFLKAWNFIQENPEVKSFSGLLYRIARNSIIDLYRAKAAKPETRMNEDTDVGDGGRWYADVSNKMETEKILQVVKKLKQEYQEVIILKYIDELDIDEIVEITGKGKIAVRVTLHRALKKLKDLL
jgi:RNA polymerase sigma-70 factor, ECF subfamily